MYAYVYIYMLGSICMGLYNGLSVMMVNGNPSQNGNPFPSWVYKTYRFLFINMNRLVTIPQKKWVYNPTF